MEIKRKCWKVRDKGRLLLAFNCESKIRLFPLFVPPRFAFSRVAFKGGLFYLRSNNGSRNYTLLNSQSYTAPRARDNEFVCRWRERLVPRRGTTCRSFMLSTSAMSTSNRVKSLGAFLSNISSRSDTALGSLTFRSSCAMAHSGKFLSLPASNRFTIGSTVTSPVRSVA